MRKQTPWAQEEHKEPEKLVAPPVKKEIKKAVKKKAVKGRKK